MNIETCIGCNIKTEKIDGAVHKYLESSAGCWARFGEILVREYENHAYMSVHGLTVDAYALQHPGTHNPQTMSSVYVHLGSLYCYFELGKSIGSLSAIKQEITRHKSQFVWLEPPENITEITVEDILKSESAITHCKNVKKWAAYVFNGWSVHHGAIADILLLVKK